MKKIPTLFERDWIGDRSRVIDRINPACVWVARGEGVATRKIDGTCCLVRDGKLYKRREYTILDFHKGKIPADFEKVEQDDVTGKQVGWIPVGEGSENRWYREARTVSTGMSEGTYELIGPKIQGNPERASQHVLIPHVATGELRSDPPRSFGPLCQWFISQEHDVEGVVWHHSDGRMAKIKMRDFGLKRSVAV